MWRCELSRMDSVVSLKVSSLSDVFPSLHRWSGGREMWGKIVSNYKLHSAFFHFITPKESTMKIKLRLVMEFHRETRNAGTLERFNKFYAELAKLSEYSHKFMNVSFLLHRARRSKQKETLEGVIWLIIYSRCHNLSSWRHTRFTPRFKHFHSFSMTPSRSNVPCSSSIRIVNWNNSITKMFSLIF